jgi:hypothetical protein
VPLLYWREIFCKSVIAVRLACFCSADRSLSRDGGSNCLSWITGAAGGAPSDGIAGKDNLGQPANYQRMLCCQMSAVDVDLWHCFVHNNLLHSSSVI